MTSDNRDKNEIREAKRSALREKFAALIWRIKSLAENALFPEDITCDACGAELTANTRYSLCAECISILPTTGEHICLSCGVPLTDEADYCLRCENSEYRFALNRSPMVFDGKARELIHALKFGGKKYIAKTIGAMMADEYIKRKLAAEIAVFVPMTRNEEKKRGFNQSELLAREVAQRLNMPLLPALVKVRDTGVQKKLTGKERAENLDGAFVCTFNQVKRRKILLIDDVFTTGATANACTDVLLKEGAREVIVLTAAVTKKKIPVESEDGTTAR